MYVNSCICIPLSPPKPFTHPFGRHACWCVSVFVYQTLFSHSHHHHRRPLSPITAHRRLSQLQKQPPQQTTSATSQWKGKDVGGAGATSLRATWQPNDERRHRRRSSLRTTTSPSKVSAHPPPFFFLTQIPGATSLTSTWQPNDK